MLLHSLLVIFGVITVCTCSPIVTLLKNYLSLKNLKTVLLVSCDNKPNINPIELEVSLKHEEIWLNVWDITNKDFIPHFDYDHFFIRLSNTPCVIMDVDCNATDAFMEEISKRRLFHYERSWLIFGSDYNRSIAVLRHQSINVDAEISLVIPGEVENHNEMFDVYDIYSVSNKYDSLLNVTRSGDWDDVRGLTIESKQTKIENRRNLHGITLSAAITVMV